MKILVLTIAAAVAASVLSTASPAASVRPPTFPTPSLVAQALCIHAGYRYGTVQAWKGQHPDYVLFGRAYFRAHRYDDVTGGPGPNGEGGWPTLAASNLGYAGGMSFTLGTYQRADALLGEPRTPSLSAIAADSPQEQIRHAVAIRVQDGDWGEWPSTSSSCGYP